MTLLHLRELTRDLMLRPTVISERLDDRNRELAEVTHAADFIVSGQAPWVPPCPRQRVGRFVRKTLSFSKCEDMHFCCLMLFIHRYNLEHANIRF